MKRDYYELKSHYSQVRYLYDTIEGLKDESNTKRKVLLTLLYWKVFDGIDIPDEIMQTILKDGTNPETILRSLRKIHEENKKMEGD